MKIRWVLFTILFSPIFSQEFKEDETTFVGSRVNLACKSSYAPIWTWFGNNAVKNLAIGAVKQKKFNNARYLKSKICIMQY